MYNFHDIELEIEQSGNKKRDSAFLKQECKEILAADIDEALERMKILREEYKETQSVEKWLRILIFQVLYEYLSDEQATMRQKELLSRIGLSEDIFTKHWKMYSPDFKAKQSKFTKIDTGFARDEVESNPVYVAMVHFLTMYADVPTKSFVDFFGKMGIVPALCANGYSYRMVFTQDKRLEIFQAGLKSPVKVYKEIKKLQSKMESETEKESINKAVKLAEKNECYTFCTRLKQEQDEDLSKIAAAFYQASYFRPDYWVDRLINPKGNYEAYYGEYSGKTIYESDKTKVAREKTRNFCSLTKEEFQTLSRLYKKLEISCMDGKDILANEEIRQTILSKSWLLYLDVPKYIREQERFCFSTENYMRLASLLQQYQGNWILTWKNYIYKEEYKVEGKGKTALFREKEISEFTDVAGLKRILGEIGKIQETTNRKLFVFKFRVASRNTPDSIVFITNIDFKEITTEEFAKKYGLELSGNFYKQDFDDFYNTTLKWTAQKYLK